MKKLNPGTIVQGTPHSAFAGQYGNVVTDNGGEEINVAFDGSAPVDVRRDMLWTQETAPAHAVWNPPASITAGERSLATPSGSGR